MEYEVDKVIKGLMRIERHCKSTAKQSITLDEKLRHQRNLKKVSGIIRDIRLARFDLEDAEKLSASTRFCYECGNEV